MRQTLTDLAEWVRDARRRTLEMVGDLQGDQLLGACLPTVNPVLWEVGHVAWFQEKWVLRHAAGQPSGRSGVDRLYDSDAVAHNTRWNLPLLAWENVHHWLAEVEERVLERLDRWSDDAPELYFVRLSVLHEDMHGEAFCYTRQTLGYPPPPVATIGARAADGPLAGDVFHPGGDFRMGGDPEEIFVFDNEKWAHEVRVAPFFISRAPVTEGEFEAFVEDGGYSRAALWSEEGWRWRTSQGVEAPLYWQREGSGWMRRVFDSLRPLAPHSAMMHLSWYEAEAFCTWAGRRLPTEAEWELASSGAGLGNLDAVSLGPVDVAAAPHSDTPEGCRQMLGNVWEWTADRFTPYPGFRPDPYATYSAPYFDTHRVLRGGCWATRQRLARRTYRNFYLPHRRDVFAGFRTCAQPAPGRRSPA